jgi:hypothetical protein
MNRRNSSRGLIQSSIDGQDQNNFFLKNQENEDFLKQSKVDKKKEYAMEL